MVKNEAELKLNFIQSDTIGVTLYTSTFVLFSIIF